MTKTDLVPMLLDVSIDPCDGSVHSSLQYVLIRGFTAMGWEQPKAASEDMAMEILKMIRPSNLAAGGTVKPSKQSVVGENPISQGMLRTQEIMCAETMKAKIATLAQRFWSIHPSEIAAKNLTREQFYAREMEKLLIQPGPSDPSSTRSEVTASLEGDAVERVAGLLRKFHRDSCYPEAMAGELNAAVNAILATGLVAGEAAIRADEREKCAKVAVARSDAVMAEAEAAHEDENYDLYERLECQAGDYADLAAAIRSGGTNER